ncbi:MAG: TolC family protein, partial [Chitinophagaceae bacterium]|nr:TolC family protein [Chitinophagaceae bacterium]
MLNRIFHLIIILISFSASAQQGKPSTLTLQQCVELAVTNNVEVKQGSLQVEAAKVNYNQSKANLLPSFNSAINHGINQGRSID